MPGKMKLPTVIEHQHPPWCDRGLCRVNADPMPGTHLSSPITVPLNGDGVETAIVQLSQRAHVAGFPDPVPLVNVEFRDSLDDGDGGMRYALTLPVDHARELAHVVRSIARRVEP